MSQPRESFPILEDGSGVGFAPSKANEGDASAGKVAMPAFVYKDAAGNFIWPQLTADGKVPVSSEGGGTPFRGQASVAGSVGSFVDVLVIPVTALTAANYSAMRGHVACRRGAWFRLKYKDTSSEVIRDEVILDSGQYSYEIGLDADDLFAVPASAAAPTFVIEAQNFDVASDLKGSLALTKF